VNIREAVAPPPPIPLTSRPEASELISQLLEGRPARIEPLFGVLVRFHVEILAADRAETGALGPAENLLRQLVGDRFARPDAQVELVVGDVIGSKLVRGSSGRIVELTRRDMWSHLGVTQTTHAGAGELHLEREPEDRSTRDLGDLEVDRNAVRHGLVALPAEHKRIEVDVDALMPDLAQPEAQAAKVDRSHVGSVTLQPFVAVGSVD
jgi:hypothetical protein